MGKLKSKSSWGQKHTHHIRGNDPHGYVYYNKICRAREKKKRQKKRTQKTWLWVILIISIFILIRWLR